ESRHLAELAFERRGDGRRHDLGPRAGVEGHDLDRRIVDLRQCGDRQLLVGDEARQQQADHEERGGDRPEDEGPGQAQGAFAGGLRSPVFCAVTFEPFWSLSTPSVTTCSPAAMPLPTTARSPLCCDTCTGRIATVPSAAAT